MGRLFDRFGTLRYNNEAEVSQNFITPLLEQFLGYASHEILPEKYYKAKDVYSGVKFSEGGSKSLNHRPDFVVCLNGDQDDPKFIIDSKGPDEGIDDHLGQLRSYAISVGRNLMMLTNGKEIKVYDVNELLFHSIDIDDLQLKVNAFVHLLGRENQALKSQFDILKSYNYDEGVTTDALVKIDQEIKKRKVILSDFDAYLDNVFDEHKNWHLPTKHFHALDNLNLQKIDPHQLLKFHRNGERHTTNSDLGLIQIIRDPSVKIKIFSGETGTGKTSLLKYLTFRTASECRIYRELTIPVFVQLREIGQGASLENLIINALNKLGYRCNNLVDLPEINDFVFYLDAYDEINVDLRKESYEAIERLSVKSAVFLTTRPSFIPRFHPSLIFDILPISEAQTVEIIRKHINYGYYEFNRQIERHNLKREARNILLLLFLISLYKETGTFPKTVNGIISSIVERVKQWQGSKSPFATSVRWEAIETCLAQFAFNIMQNGDVAIQFNEAEKLVLPVISDLALLRKIPQNMMVDELLSILAETGLLVNNKNHIYFWHRLFIYHFASIHLKQLFLTNPQAIGNLLPEPRWHVVIAAVASQLSDITDLVNCVEKDLWLAAYCLIENPTCKSESSTRIINALIENARSKVPEASAHACNFLEKIDLPAVLDFLYSAIDQDFPAGVKMFALSTIGKTRSDKALDIINQYIDWDESEYIFGPYSRAYVCRGLYYYDEFEHLKIVESWSKSPNWLLAQECKRIFLELTAQEKLTHSIIGALQDLFLKNLEAEYSSQETLDALGQILSLSATDNFFIRVIDAAFAKEQLSKTKSIKYLLANCKSMSVMLHLKNKIENSTDQRYIAQELMDVLVESVAPIPREFFYELTEHNNTNIAAEAIGALSRFEYETVREKVEKHLFGQQPQLQSWALKVLVDNGEIIHSIYSGGFPSPFFLPTAHTLLEAVQIYHLADALPLMLRIKNALLEQERYTGEVPLAMELAASYYLLGENEQQEEIIGWFFDGQKFLQESDNIHFHIMKSVKSIDPQKAVKLVDCFFTTYFPFNDDKGIRFNSQVFLEAVEDLGQAELIPRVKEIAEMLIESAKSNNKNDGFSLERPMRTLAKIALPSDEDWILSKLDDLNYDPGFERPQLRRAIECLAQIGGKKSLPYLKAIAIEYNANAFILNVCQQAFEQISEREKIPNVNDVLTS